MVCRITVKVTNLRSSEGQICLSVFDQAQGFPGEAEQAIAKGVVDASEPIYTFEGLEMGDYAIAVFHDENGDGVFNKGLFGIPREGFGFSNNPKILVGAPSFKAAALTLREDHVELVIQLKYF